MSFFVQFCEFKVTYFPSGVYAWKEKYKKKYKFVMFLLTYLFSLFAWKAGGEFYSSLSTCTVYRTTVLRSGTVWQVIGIFPDRWEC